MTDDKVSRRDLLKGGAALGAAALVGDAGLGGALSQADARARACHGSLKDVEHIVILMQENRSFDSYFGTFPGVRGFGDHRNRRAFAQPGYHGPGSRNGHLLPFHFDGRDAIAQCAGNVDHPTHSWGPQHLSWNHGRNDRFYATHARPQPEYDGNLAPIVMGYFEQQDIPYYWALAREYTLCDRYFCSVIGPTEPNRLYSISATLDPAGTHGGPCVETTFTGAGLIGNFSWTTMPEQLQARGISWKSYTDFAGSGQFDTPFTAFNQFHSNPTLNRLGIAPTYPQDFLHDLANDQLPSVSWIQVGFTESEHPGFSPAAGEYAVDQVLRQIWSRPHIWRKTVVIINHDENGGYFDHVAPPVAPRGTRGEYLTVPRLPEHARGIRGPIGLGFRVPTIVVSPWTRGGLICSDVFDHTSVLRLIERRFGAEVPNLTHWRRSVTGDMTSVFNFAARPNYSVPRLPRTSITTPPVTDPPCPAGSSEPYPVPAHIAMPRQRSGRARRPSGLCGRPR